MDQPSVPPRSVLVVGRSRLGAQVSTVLARLGVEVHTAESLTDALKQAGVTMPHIIIAESQFLGGTVADLYKGIAGEEGMPVPPLLALLKEKSPQELEPLKSIKVAAALIGGFDPKSLVQKVFEIANGGHSPYSIDSTEIGFETSVFVSCPAKAMGVTNDQLVVESPFELDSKARVFGVPKSDDSAPAILKMAVNRREQKRIFNIFPLSRVTGKGLKWIRGLPNLEASKSRAETRKLIMFMPPREFDELSGVLSTYQIEPVLVSHIDDFVAEVTRADSDAGCAYIDLDQFNFESEQDRQQMLLKLDSSEVQIIVGSEAYLDLTKPHLTHLRTPFALGTMIDLCESAYTKLGQALDGNAGMDVYYRFPATLVSVDECGGALMLGAPLPKGCKLMLDHPELSEIWGDHRGVTIERVHSHTSSMWKAEFQADFVKGTSRGKYYAKVRKLAQSRPKSA